MGDLAGEVGSGKALRRIWAHGLADGAGWQAGHAPEDLPLLGDAELFETGVATPRPAQDVALQTVQQGDVAALAEEEVGAGAQVFLQLPARTAGHRLQGTLAQPCAPQAGEQQQQRCRQGLGGSGGRAGW